MLDKALADAGIPRNETFVTNAGARSVMGRAVTIGKLRGEALSLDDGTRVVITIHPSALLRTQDEAARHAAYAAFVKDLKVAAGLVFGKSRRAA
jgi:DNA polymerase